MRKAPIVLIVLFGIFLTIGCMENKPVTPNETGTPEKTATSAEVVTATGEKATGRQTATEMQNVTENTGLKEFTLEELAEYNGKNGTTYVAYQGRIYDVSNSSYWINGTHKGCNAGTDLTGKIENTPHGTKILKAYPFVGILKE